MNNWNDYGLFWLYIYIHEQFSLVYLLPIPMISLLSWFLYCNTCSRVRRAWNLMGTSVRPFAKVLSFVWEKLLFHREVTCFLINNLFGKVFQTSRVIGLITLLSKFMWNSNVKKVFKLWEKVFSSLKVHRKPSFHNSLVISIFYHI